MKKRLSTVRYSHFLQIKISATLLLMLSGCGESGPTIVHVSGKVTFDGASPPTNGYLNFAPVETYGNETSRPGYAKFDTSGEFVAVALPNRSGLKPGKYLVRVECWKHPPEPVPGGEEAATYVSPAFKPFELDIVMDSNPIEDLVYDVPLKK